MAARVGASTRRTPVTHASRPSRLRASGSTLRRKQHRFGSRSCSCGPYSASCSATRLARQRVDDGHRQRALHDARGSAASRRSGSRSRGTARPRRAARPRTGAAGSCPASRTATMRSRPKLRTAQAAMSCAEAPSSAALTLASTASRSLVRQPAQVSRCRSGGIVVVIPAAPRPLAVPRSANRSPGSRSRHEVARRPARCSPAPARRSPSGRGPCGRSRRRARASRRGGPGSPRPGCRRRR